MRHTLLEQSITIGSTETLPEDILKVFIDDFDYTKNGDYYYSPFDTKFGIRFYINGNNLSADVTFDGGITTKTWFSIRAASAVYGVYYHTSKNGYVTYLRFDYEISATSSLQRHAMDTVIAVDENNNTICYRGRNYTALGHPSSITNLYLTDKSNTNFPYDYLYTTDYHGYNTRPNMQSAIYKYPSITGCCMHKDLYGIVNVQSFDTLSNAFINFDGQIYRIVSCMDVYLGTSTLTMMPYFAFPVAD